MDEHEKYRLSLLGPFGFFMPDGRRIEVSSKKAIALIALLVAAPNGLRTRVWLQSMLWGSRDTPQAQASLRRELSTLVKILEAHDASHLLVRESQRIKLEIDSIAVDMLSLNVGATQAADRKGDFLEGVDLRDCEEFEDWLRGQRTRITSLLAVDIPAPTGPLPTAQEVLGGPLPPRSDLLHAIPPKPPSKPSVAVLPFAQLARTGESNWLGAGIAQEVGMMLAQLPQLFVVASISAAALAERQLTHVEIARQLGVRYLLDGTIQQSGERLRVAVSLLDGSSGQQVWSHRIDGSMDDLFTLQENVAALVAPRIWTEIDLAERHRVLSQPPRTGDSYELYWRANALFRSWDRDAILEAITLTDELVTRDPTCALSASLAAFCNGVAFAFRWTQDPPATRRAAVAHYENALRYGSSNVEALGYAAGTLVSIGGDMVLAERIISHALSLLPACQPTLFWGGWVDIAIGNAARARERFELALRINPASGVRAYTLTGIGVASLVEGDAAGAYAMLAEAAIHIPTYPVTIAALCTAAMMAGERDAARRAAASLEALGGLDQVLSIFQNPRHREMIAAATRMASAPEPEVETVRVTR